MRTYMSKGRTGARTGGTMTPYRRRTGVSTTKRKTRKPRFIVPYVRGGPLARVSSGDIPKSRFYRSNQTLSHIVAQSEGSTKSRYSDGRPRASRKIYDLFRNNQDWIATSTGTTKLKNTVYGAQIASYQNHYPNTQFAIDLANAVGGTLSSSVINTSELFYGKTTVVSTFTNTEVTTAYMHIYELSPRFHMVTEAGYNPVVCWKSGIDDAYGSVINAHNKVYNSPFDSQMFTRFYKVKKVIKLVLSPGQSHEHISTYYHNKGLFGAVTAPYEINRTMSNMHMIIASGTPISDATTNTLISTSTISINCVRRTTRNYTYAPQLRSRYIYSESLGAITSANVVTDVQKIIDTEA